MFFRSITWFIWTSVAVAIATGYSGQDSNTGSDSEVTVDHLTTDDVESYTAEPVQEVRPNATVDLGALLDAGEGAVVSLVSGDTRLAAHRAVLSARSAVFQRILQDAATGEVAVPDVEGPVLRQLVSYLYTLQAPQLPGMAPQLIAAADQYGLPALKADCEQQVAKQLSLRTAAATAVLAIRHSCDSLRMVAIAYIRDHIFQVMGTQGWADETRSQTEVMIKVARLLSESTAETSSSAAGESGSHACHTTQPHSDYSGHQTPTTAAPRTVAQTITQTDDHISLLRSLSLEEKNRRLIEAAKQRDVRELVALLAAGADVGARDGVWQLAALHWAADWGELAAVRLLLAAGADHGARDVDGRTPLHLAAFRGHREAAAALLQAGADRAAMDSRGETPLDYARQRNHQQLVQLLQGDSGLAAGTAPE